MKNSIVFCLLVVIVSAWSKAKKYRIGNDRNEISATEFLNFYNVEAAKQIAKFKSVDWKFMTNLTDENQKLVVEASLRYAEFEKKAWEKVTKFAWLNFTDPILRRQFEKISHLGIASLDSNKLTEFKHLKANMISLFNKAEIYLTDVMAKSSNYDELEKVWVSWRETTGKPNRNNFLKLVEFSNNISRFDGFENAAEEWLNEYEDDEIEKEFERIWQQVRPLYLQLHAYVRRKLIQKYGTSKIKPDGPLPAHLLGNMWAQSWENLYPRTAPFPEKLPVDVTEAMVKQNYTVAQMFKLAEQFFLSMGLDPMPELFWKKSIFEEPIDREIVCQGSAWDFYDGKDFRIKQCAVVTMKYLESAHHEMGHIEYYLQYNNQPVMFRRGANPGFHEAIGDLISVSVTTPKHLAKLGLMKNASLDDKMFVNFLYSRALTKITSLPFAYLIDKWRWGVFRGEIEPNEMNSKYWEYRLKYQGLVPPVHRSDSDFDPASIFHVAAHVECSRYYVAAILQLQFHKILCAVTGHKGPLYTCDMEGSKAAGRKLGEMMKLGSSKPWPEALELLSGGRTVRMDATPLMEYFEPLMKWLQETNTNEFIGWK